MTKANKGVSTIFASVLFLILITVVVSSLVVAFERFNLVTENAIEIDNARLDEKIVLIYLTTDESNKIENIVISNHGSILSTIRAIYIDNKFICDPSLYTSSSISPQTNLSMTIIPQQTYDPDSFIAVTTEKGTKSMELESNLKGGTPPEPGEVNSFGPLRLHYLDFKYAESIDGVYPPPNSEDWIDAWYPVRGEEITWRITVDNTIDRDITLNQYSCFTLVTAYGSRSQLPWYLLEVVHEDGSVNNRIAAHETDVKIFYKYGTPQSGTQKITFPSDTVCNVFLTFYGVFHEVEGTSPYGQTIPFQSVKNT